LPVFEITWAQKPQNTQKNKEEKTLIDETEQLTKSKLNHRSWKQFCSNVTQKFNSSYLNKLSNMTFNVFVFGFWPSGLLYSWSDGLELATSL